MLSHIVKRGVQHFQSMSPEYMGKLQQDAELYENADMNVSPQEMLPVFITGAIVLFILASIRYTIGYVVASLAMIESPSSIDIVETKLPAYADEEPLIPTERDADIEMTVINQKPITTNVSETIRLLRSVGGFRACWRGYGISILYHLAHSLIAGILSRVLGVRLLFGNVLVSIITSVLLARLHMLWTHTMIAHPTSKSFLQRIVPRKQCKTLFLPAFVFAVAQQATFLLPLAVASLVDLENIPDHAFHAVQRDDPTALALMTLRILAVLTTAAVVALFVLLPASATLMRIEAALLPADTPTLVPFDRAALVGDIDTTACGASRKLFVAAWRSFDRSARLRLVTLYVKMTLAQIAVGVAGALVMAAEVYLIGGERLTILLTSAWAQLEIMAIEAKQSGVQS
ncbi:hypothetical protein C8R43DRAFT_889559 [Mycena crocata]|nr:hypothetical protein C8R43DRAFT_889559 [Mycena crocata]